jgi:hypothetical protein
LPAIALAGLGAPTAGARAQEFNLIIRNHKFEPEEIHVTMSFGVAGTTDLKNADDLLRAEAEGLRVLSTRFRTRAVKEDTRMEVRTKEELIKIVDQYDGIAIRSAALAHGRLRHLRRAVDVFIFVFFIL